ncbi:hypothetical protein RRG08_008706 [Elysia crispata]|uniref:Uncharacterized protein n=1 Tax=Elysia crispata TaxID=231223 RepID=A0AAE0XPU2_9GAST|nr:hypothetical protein RRG08_008706 [Elysia crispata]
MDESYRHDNPNPTLKANPLSIMLFWWLDPLFKKGYKGWLEESDMYNVCPGDSSQTTGEKLQASWDKELDRQKQGKQTSLTRALTRAVGLQYMLIGLLGFLEKLIQICQPVLVAEFLDYFTPDSSSSRLDAWLYATGIVLSSVVLGLFHHPYLFNTCRLGMKIRVGLCSMIYKKSLRLSNKSLNESSVGQIVNLMSNDVSRFDRATIFLHYLWIGPIQVIIGLVYLWYRFGLAVLSSLILVVLLMPLQFFMGDVFSKLRRKTAVHTDKRVKVMNEIISGIRIIKLYCWEKPFGLLVNSLRRLEVRQLRRTRRVQACVLGPYFATAQASVFLFTLVYVLTDREDDMRPATVFLLMGVIQSLRLTCGLHLPLASQHLAEVWVSIKRIQAFLSLEEHVRATDSPARTANGHSDDHRGQKTVYGVELRNLTARWEGAPAGVSTLENITVSVSPGRLVAVIGPVGSGKTSLLMSYLGELSVQSGSVNVRGKIAYVSQNPWIFSGSVRQNILFGNKFDKSRYDQVIRITALSRDLSILPKGDATLIGDRGVTLSGGQKARVSLARAIYMDADVYLLDDPLAAVDTVVGRHIFEKCIVKYLKDKPRILVTHQVQLLPVADNIVILTDGKMVGQGTYAELSKSGVDFSELLKLSEDDKLEMSLAGHDKSGSGGDHETIPGYKRPRAGSTTSLDSLGDDYVPDAVQLPEEEERETGSVDLKVFTEYFKAGAGICFFTLLVLFVLLAQVLYVASDWWLARWTNKIEDRHSALEANSHNTTSGDIPEVDTYQNLYIYTGIIAALFVSALVRAFLFFRLAVVAGETLHNNMFSRILRTVMGFFDTNPVGRVLNRFSKDTGQVDDLLPWTMFDVLQNALQTVGIVVAAAIFNPWVLIPVLPLLVVLVLIRRYYVQTSRSVKRLESTTRSPVFSHLSASLQGLHTIRAMHMEQKLSTEFNAHQDLHTEAWFLFLSTSRWLGIRMDILSVVFIACVVYLSVLTSDSMDAGYVGLSAVYTIHLMGLFQWTVRQSVELENQMIAVERVLQYTRLPIEAALESKPGQGPPDTWPSSGSIRANRVSLQYSPLSPFVLKNISFDIRGGEKVGIVGRTGAGKSSLITTLFRLAEPEGELTIDGVSIHRLGLHDLRKAISIIPQDPVLFTGSVRRNLDPFDEYSDSQLWRALDEVQLKDAITSHPDNLYMEVSEGGSNFSAGQRQLMCLARAVLGNTRILVIDEATANVDPITDELIQQTIRSKFKACTVLTIAHRLHTIIDSDRVMVLDAGKVVEMDTPAALLAQEGGLFSSMVEQLGRAEKQHLTEMATANIPAYRTKSPSALTNDVNHRTSDAATDGQKAKEALSPEVGHDNDGRHLKASDSEVDLGTDNRAFTPDVTRL